MLSKTLQAAEAMVKYMALQVPGVREQAPKIIQSLRQREQKGLETYGETLDTAEGYDWKQMILEELQDGLMYITKYAAVHGSEDVVTEAGMLVVLMATLQGALHGSEEHDTVRDETTGGEDGNGGSGIILLG